MSILQFIIDKEYDTEMIYRMVKSGVYENEKDASKKMGMRLYIGGASGCGKTTLAQACSQILHVPHFTGSAVMMKVAGGLPRLTKVLFSMLTISNRGQRVAKQF